MKQIIIILSLLLTFGYSQGGITLDQFRVEMKSLRADITALESRLNTKIAKLEGEIRGIRGEIQGIRGEISIIKWAIVFLVMVFFAVIALPNFNRLLERRRETDSYLDARIKTLIKEALKEKSSH